jgi:hypothetical protein
MVGVGRQRYLSSFCSFGKPVVALPYPDGALVWPVPR